MPRKPMPIALVLAANDYRMPCMMSVIQNCPHLAAYLNIMSHTDTTPHCDPQMQEGLPFCEEHTRVLKSACGPLAAYMGIDPPPDCECGKTVTLHNVLTLRGEPAYGAI